VFVIAILERESLLDPTKKWFDLFPVLFELVSALGGIGLSLGIPGVRRFSFSDVNTDADLVHRTLVRSRRL
jgi:Trk-type K+ transport system membrane component